jgi:heterodisulfide reductase subunit A
MLRPVGADPSVHPVLVRAPSDLVQGLGSRTVTGWLAHPAARRAPGEDERTDIEVLPVTNHIIDSLCRACGTCVEACPFHAISFTSQPGKDPSAYIDPALCRGCNLCTGVCPTHAAASGTRPAAWWRGRLQEVLHKAASQAKGQAPRVVLACDSQTDELEQQLGQNGHQVVLIDLRCVGEVNSGMLLELARQGAERVVVAGCGGDGCRYGTGALLAAKQVDQARSLLRTMGMDDRQIATDWTGERVQELVEAPLNRFLDMSGIGGALAGPIVGKIEGQQEVKNA